MSNQRPAPAAPSSIMQCIALLSFGCDVSTDCCNRNVCQRNTAEDAVGSCQTVSTTAAWGCYMGRLPRLDCPVTEALRTLPAAFVPPLLSLQCVALSKSGCATSRNCCGSNLCQRQALTSAVGTCKTVRRCDARPSTELRSVHLEPCLATAAATRAAVLYAGLP